MAIDDIKPLNPGVEASSSSEAIKEISPTSVFVNSEPVREDQVENAVKFLSHPKVRGSAVMYRRSFLERKGLTKEEIDEAFRRVPDPHPSVTAAVVQSSSTDGQITSSSGVQTTQSSNHIQQQLPASAPATTVGNLNQSRFNLRQALLTVGIVSASGAGAAVLFKKTIIPRLKSWIRKVVLEEEDENLAKKVDPKPSPVEEAGAAAKAAASAAAEVARTTQEMMASKTEERKFFNELQNMLDVQVKEMKSMSSAIKNLEGQISSRDTISSFDSRDFQQYSSRANGKVDFDLQAAKYKSQSAQAESSLTPHQKSYMEEIMEMIQNGENPNIKDINGQMLNQNQQTLTNSQTTFLKMPVEDGEDQHGEDDGLNVMNGGDNPNPVPWWQKKAAENGNSSSSSSSSSAFQGNERPIQLRSSWVPPQPPPVAMAEAAAAIRHQKNQKQAAVMVDEGVVGSSSNGNIETGRNEEINTIEV